MVAPERVVNGTFGSIWINDQNMGEVTGLEAKVTIEKTEVNQTGTLSKGYKITGMDGKGTVKLNKVSSFFINLLSDSIKEGKTVTATIRSKLADPDTVGAEDVTLKGCTFDELTLADWEAKKLTEESIPFNFTDWDINETIQYNR